MELNGLIHEADARTRHGIQQEIRIGQRAGIVGEPEQAREPLVRPHRDQLPAAVHPGVEHRGLRISQRRLREDNEVVAGQSGRGDQREIGDVERVEALTT